jgi:hypothetical protein
MGVRRFNPSDRPPVRFVLDEELAGLALTPGCQVGIRGPHWLSSSEPCFDAQ